MARKRESSEHGTNRQVDKRVVYSPKLPQSLHQTPMTKTSKNLQGMPWHSAFDLVVPYVVKITTPSASGTGFVVALSANKKLMGIATAAHVIDHPHYWQQPIRIEHFQSGKTLFLNHADRFISVDESHDTGSVVVRRGDFPVPEESLQVISESDHLRVGVEVGWVGFPAIAASNLCFFSGSISCWVPGEEFYFVDGVAINGVSGGPAFYVGDDGELQVIGIVSAYVPNRSTGAQLPGLCVIRDVASVQGMIKELKSVEQAKEQEKTPETPPPPQLAPTVGSEPTRS
jgi:hypothetical protein